MLNEIKNNGGTDRGKLELPDIETVSSVTAMLVHCLLPGNLVEQHT